MKKNTKKAFIKICVLMVLILVLTVCIIPVWDVSAAQKKATKLELIKMITDGIAKSHLKAGKYTLSIDNGTFKAGSKKISDKTIKKYMDKYKLSREDAGYCALAVKAGFVKSSDLKKLKKTITRAVAANLIAQADKLIYAPKITDSDIDFVLKKRIADSDKFSYTKTAKNGAYVFIRGYMTGTAEAAYSDLRYFKPSTKLTVKEAEKLVSMLTGKTERYSLSPSLQVLRKNNLPQNAELYEYILDSYPNAIYETGFNGMTSHAFFESGKGLGADDLMTRMSRTNFTFVFPYEVKAFNALAYPGPDFSYSSNVFLSSYRNDDVPAELAKSSVEFYEYALNVDYRTVKNDKDWQDVMKKYLSSEELNDYIKHCVENKTIIVCDKVAADESLVYWYNGEYNCKVYAHFKVVSDIPLENGKTAGTDQDTYGYLYPVKRGYEPGTLFTRSVLGKLYMGYKMGEWTDLYFNTSGSADMYGSLCCSNTSRGIMIDYSGLYPWLYKLPF